MIQVSSKLGALASLFAPLLLEGLLESIKKLGVTQPSGVECAAQSVCPRREGSP
jgi:hypothetical protein